MNTACKLALSFDPAPLKRDLQLLESDWIAHFNTGYHEGEWLGIAMRSVGGVANQLYPDPNASGDVVDTPVLDRCRHLKTVIAAFECPIRSARLLKLAAGSSIKEHRDYDLGYDTGEIRLHIPIVTSPEIDFFLDGKRIAMREGECWYLNVYLPHSVENRSTIDRVHLVMDCGVNEWLRSLLPSDVTQQLSAMKVGHDAVSSPEALAQFRESVLQNLDLQRQMRDISGRERFIKLVVTLGEKAGFHFAAADVEEAMRVERKLLLERWIE